MVPLLDARDLAHRFEYPLFEHVNLTLNPSESIAIVGVSGSGKSTLLHILSSLLRPNEGSVHLLGEDIYGLSERALVDLRRYQLGLIYQHHYLFKGFSAYENLEVAAMLAHQNIDTYLLERLKIDHVIHQKVTELSGGQQQRVSIARVLVKKPRIIFADEPTGNLDHATALDVMGLFESYIAQQRAGLILVTHDEVLARRCQRIYRLDGLNLTQIDH